MKRKMMSSTLASLLAFSSTGMVAHAQQSPSKPTTQEENKLIHALVTANSAKIDLRQTFDIFDWAALRIGGQAQVKPAFNKGLFQRIDRYFVEGRLGPKADLGVSMEDKTDFGVSAYKQNKSEISFVRYYPTATQAARAGFYGVANIPKTSQRALKNLNEGDYFVMKMPSNLVVSGNFLAQLGVNVALSAEAHYILSGDFQLHVLRKSGNKIRVKLVNLEQDEKGGSVGLRLGGPVSFLKFDYLNKRLLDKANIEPMKLSFSSGHNKAIMVDYSLDLSNPTVAAAYDQVFQDSVNAQKIWQDLSVNSVFKRPEMIDIVALDSLAMAGKIERSFKGQLDSDFTRRKIELDFGLLKFSMERDNTDNRISSVSIIDQKEQTKHYTLKSSQTRTKSGTILNYLSLFNQTNLSTVYSTDPNFKNPSAQGLIMSLETRDSSMKKMDYDLLKEKIRRLAPANVYSMIQFPSLGDKSKNVGAFFQMVIHPSGLDNARTMNKAEIKAEYEQFLTKFGKEELSQEITGNKVNQFNDSSFTAVLYNSVNKTSVALEKALNKSISLAERQKSIETLKDDELFRKVGVGFLATLLDQSHLEQDIRVDLKINSPKEEGYKFTFGEIKENPVYDYMMYLQGIVNNDGHDLRLEAETMHVSRMKKK